MLILHLTGSPFFGGPERLMLGLVQSLPESCRSAFALFADQGKSLAFRRQLLDHGLETITLTHDTPHLPAMVRELTSRLREWDVDVLCCHGYKADIVGLLAARRAGVPVIAMSHGWTAETWKVRVYEALDRACLRRMDRVVCVSEGQAEKVRRAGVRADRVVVIRNAVRAERFDRVDPADRRVLEEMFPQAPERIVGSAGRLSPEKGFGVLVEAAAIVARSDPGAGFIHFGDGPLRETIRRRIEELGLERRFILAGFRDDLDRFCPIGTSRCCLHSRRGSDRGARVVRGGGPGGGDRRRRDAGGGRRRGGRLPRSLSGVFESEIHKSLSPNDL